MKMAFADVKTKKAAEKLFPWADKIIKVQDGYMAFESASDYRIWKNQK